jgi:GT2 family glycosyltransferase
MRGELLEELGLFDEGYFFFLEETDYCWRVREAGYRVVYCDALRTMHRLGASSKRRAPLATRIEFHRSLYRFLERRRGSRVAAIAYAARVVRNSITGIGLLLLSIGSDRARTRLVERWGLLLWHLRGRRLEPNLARALQIGMESEHRVAA